MANAWSDLGDTAAHATNKPEFSTPIPGVNTAYVLRQRFMQPLANYSALALNTAHPDYSSYKLVEETDFKDETGGIVTWTRVYAAVPAQHVEMSTMNYSFIGFWGPFPSIGPNGSSTVDPSNPATAYGRNRAMHYGVKVKSQFDYYLVDGSIIATIYDIPVISEQRYLNGAAFAVPSDVDAIWNAGYIVGSSGFSILYASSPSKSTYQGWITADAASASSFSICVQTSKVERWMGNIFRRETLFVKAI